MRAVSSSMILLAGLGLGLAIGCRDGGGSGDPANAYINKLKSCGLLSEGELPMVDTSELDDEVSCYLDCALLANCEELTAINCDPVSLVPSEALIQCYEDCEGEVGEGTFTCVDGETIPASWACDGFDDCNDGSDELDCTAFECADGSTNIPEGFVCDGFPDCPDDSDELDCPGFVACADGNGSTPESYLCDGEPDCQDGSDEEGCPTYTCADGLEVVNGARCDLNQDCPDGSDEEGCAQLVCP